MHPHYDAESGAWSVRESEAAYAIGYRNGLKMAPPNVRSATKARGQILAGRWSMAEEIIRNVVWRSRSSVTFEYGPGIVSRVIRFEIIGDDARGVMNDVMQDLEQQRRIQRRS